MTKYYSLHYVGNDDKEGEPSYYIPNIVDPKYPSNSLNYTREHFEILSRKKSLETIGVQYEEDGPIYDYCSGIEAVEVGSKNSNGKLIYDTAISIEKSEYEEAYLLLHPLDKEQEFMNMQRYLIAIKELVVSSKKRLKDGKTK